MYNYIQASYNVVKRCSIHNQFARQKQHQLRATLYTLRRGEKNNKSIICRLQQDYTYLSRTYHYCSETCHHGRHDCHMQCCVLLRPSGCRGERNPARPVRPNTSPLLKARRIVPPPSGRLRSNGEEAFALWTNLSCPLRAGGL